MITVVVDRLLPPPTDAEEREIARFMLGLAAQTSAQAPPMPGADVVWAKAQLIRRWDVDRRVQRPLETMQSVHIGLGFAAAVVLLVWSAPLLLRTFF